MLSVYFQGIAEHNQALLETELARHGFARTRDLAAAAILLVSSNVPDLSELDGFQPTVLEKIIMLSSAEVYGEGDFHCGDCGPMTVSARTAEQFETRRWELLCPICEEMLMPVEVTEAHVSLSPSPEGKRLLSIEQGLARMAARWDCSLVLLRLFSPYRPGSEASFVGAMASAFLAGEAPQISEDGCQIMDFTYYADVIQALVKSIRADNLPSQVTFNIGSGTQMQFQEVAAWLQELLGRKSLDYRFTHTYRPGDVRHRFGDISKARQLLGYQPEFDVLDGLKALSSAMLK